MMETMEVYDFIYIAHQGKNGKNGGKTMIRVPCGTLVY